MTVVCYDRFDNLCLREHSAGCVYGTSMLFCLLCLTLCECDNADFSGLSICFWQRLALSPVLSLSRSSHVLLMVPCVVCSPSSLLLPRTTFRDRPLFYIYVSGGPGSSLDKSGGQMQMDGHKSTQCSMMTKQSPCCTPRGHSHNRRCGR